MPFDPLPTTAAWAHRGARAGFEVLRTSTLEGGTRLRGTTTAVEDGQAWAVDYDVTVDAAWLTRRAVVTNRSAAGEHRVVLDSDGEGHWTVDGAPAPHLDGCLDVDLESSVVTNTLPLHRLDLPVGGRAVTPAAWVRAIDLKVERLNQSYLREEDVWRQFTYAYHAPDLFFRCLLVFDASGLIRDYPGLAERSL